MSEEKRIEQEIGWHKVAFAILVVTGISLLAWFAQNYSSAKLVLLILCIVGIFVIIVIAVIINKRVFKCLNRLEEL